MRFLSRLGRKPPRLLVIGLDCAPPHLIFDEFRADLPTLSRLIAGGTYGPLESSIPCITVPAWSSMTSSRDPGVLGVYGFRNRAAYDYNSLTVANGQAIKVPRLWEMLSEAGKQNVVIGVPQTYPPRPLNGHLVSGFLTPGLESAFTYPAIFKSEVLKVTPGYAFDATGFRTHDKAWLAQRISDVTDVQFKLLQHTLTSKPWDFAMYVNMGTDRVHHGFWRYHDPAHRLHEPDSPFRHTIRDYYKQVDAHLADLLRAVGDDVTVLIVSDHGVTRMDGAIAINEWLWRNGWLALNTPPPEGTLTRFEDADINWPRTRAWSTGGYYGRIFLNVAGREPQGVIPAGEVAAVKAELTAALQAIPAPDGTPLNTTVYAPEQIYTQTNNIPPDLLVYFGDLHWRCVGGLGYDGVHTLENDTGPDDANHAPQGLFLLHEPRRQGRGYVAGHQLMDVAPTVLERLRVTVAASLQGRVMG